MKHEIRVPAVSEGVVEGTVVNIAVAVGDSVEVDQTLLELETDKAVIEIPSTLEGKITEIRVAEGDSVAIDAVIMIMESDASADEPAAPASARKEISEPVAEVKSETPVVAEPAPDLPAAETRPSAAPVEASTVDLLAVRKGDLVAPAAPSVRRLARELGVDIYQVQGSGPGGRISATDVRSFVRVTMQRITGGGSVPAVVGEFPGLHAQRPLPDFSRWGEVTREPLSRVRELTADAMSYAWSTIPMVTVRSRAGFRNRSVSPGIQSPGY